MRKTRKFSLPEILFGLGLLLLCYRFGVALLDYSRSARAALAFPYPLDYGEGPVLDQTIRLAHSEAIYRADFSTPPYTLSNYPPLYHLIQVPFALLFGPAFWYGRAISILSALLAALMVGLILHTLTGDRIASAIGGLTLLSFPYLTHWSAFNRVDTLAFALSLVGLYSVVRWPDHRRIAWISAWLFTLAVFTKHSYALAAPLTAVAWLLQTRRAKTALRLALVFAVSCGALFLILNLLTQGGFYRNIVTANVNPFSRHTLTRYLVELYLNVPYLLIGAVLFMIVERLGESTHSWPLVTPYLFATGLVAITIGKEGSSVNYLLEFSAALSLVGGAFIAWARESVWFKAALVFVLAVQIGWLVAWSRQDYLPLIMDKVNREKEVAKLAKIVQAAAGSVLADEYMGLIPLYGGRLYFQPFEYKQLSDTGNWDQTSLVEAIQRQEFAAILLYEPRRWNAIITRWTPAQRQAIYAHYRLDQTLAETFVYLPLDQSK